MFSALKRLFPSSQQHEAYALYAELVKQARQPVFYTEMGVPDTLDGRFEMVLLHVFLVLRRLKAEESQENTAFMQLLSEAFIHDIDRSLREVGATDTGMIHKMKKVGTAFYGRLHAYDEAAESDEALRAALIRNVYGTVQAPDELKVNQLLNYIKRYNAALSSQDRASLLAGRITSF